MPMKNLDDLNSFSALKGEVGKITEQFAELLANRFEWLLSTRPDPDPKGRTLYNLKRHRQRWERLVQKLRKSRYFSTEPVHIDDHARKVLYRDLLVYKGKSREWADALDIEAIVYKR